MNWLKKEIKKGHGIVEVRANSCSEFTSYIEYVHKSTDRNKQYIWRGQSSSEWKLNSTLDRRLFPNKYPEELINKFNSTNPKSNIECLLRYEKFITIYENPVSQHLEDFKFAIRGRRGKNPSVLATDNDWWALGQHHGLCTPLLDWTGSPFVACFFGIENTYNSQSDYFAIYGLWEGVVLHKNTIVSAAFKRSKDNYLRDPIVEFIRPYSDENSRLVSQRGLFTRAPLGIDIEQWLKLTFQKDEHTDILIKIILPTKIRKEILRALNRMNINHLSLFPDLIGASQYCNMVLEDFGYNSG